MDAEAVQARTLRQISEREIAFALIFEFVEGEWGQFSLYGFYDNDADFLNNLADRLGVPMDKAFKNKLTRVVRVLVNYNVLHAKTKSTHKEYCGEPTHQRNYWLRPGKAGLIRRGKTAHTMEPEDEVAFLLRHAYPEPESDAHSVGASAGEPKDG